MGVDVLANSGGVVVPLRPGVAKGLEDQVGLEDLSLNPAAAGVVVEGLCGVHCWEVSVTVEARHRLTEAAAAR